MAREYSTVQEFLVDLNNAIDDVMQVEIAEKAIDALQEMADDNVYSYSPEFNSRRGKRGGLTDPANMKIDYDYASKTLTIDNVTEWQNVGFRKVDGSGTQGNKLVDVIQEKQVYHAPPRPFVEPAEDTYRRERFRNDLVSALHRIGF